MLNPRWEQQKFLFVDDAQRSFQVAGKNMLENFLNLKFPKLNGELSLSSMFTFKRIR